MTDSSPGASRGHLDGKVVVVTGGARGIGRAIAMRAAAEGAAVVVADLGSHVAHARDGSPAVAQQTADEIVAAGGRAVPYGADIASTEGAEGAVALARDRFGGIDGIVCCAGNLVQAEVAETADRDWDEVVRVHLRGHFACTRAAARTMIEQGRGGTILHCSSVAAVTGSADMPAYSAAKAGVLGLMVSSSRSLGRYGIRVNAILPGGATRMTDALWAAKGEADLRGISLPSDAAEGTVRDPANVAPFVVLLLGDRLAGRTGQAFAVVGHQVTQVHLPCWGPTVRSDRPWELDDLAERVERELVPSLSPTDDTWPPA